MPNDGSIILGTELDDSGLKGGLKGLGSVAKAGMSVIAAGVGAAAAGMTAFGTAAVDAGMTFDKSMAQVAATMGLTVDEIGDLREFAMDMGAKTAFSASEAADALNYMALAGYDAETSMEMLPNVLNLAAAGGIDLASASDMVTDAQSALGLSLEETSELVDKMATASSKSNTSVAQLGDAILTIGGTAKSLAGGTTELTTALGILADNGIKGAEGGTALRNVILSLSAPTDKAAKKMKELGLEVFDAEGNMRPLEDVFTDLNGALANMSEGEKTQVLSELFNKVDLKSVNALMATNKDRWRELSGAIDKAQGSAEKMADTQLDNLAGDVTLFKSALEGAEITLSNVLTPTIRDFVQTATIEIGKLDDAFKQGGIQGFADQAGETLSTFVSKIGEYTPTILQAASTLATSLISNLVATLAKEAPQIIAAAGEIVKTLGDSMLEALPDALANIGTIIGQLIADTPKLTEIGIEFIGKLGLGILQGIPGMLEGVAAGFEGLFSEPVSAEVLAAQQELEALQTSLDGIVTNIDTGLNEALGKVSTKFGEAEHWVEVFDELKDKTNLTKEEQIKLNQAVERINELMPELGGLVQDETGKWNLSTEAIKQNIQMLEARARAQVYQEKAVEIMGQIVDLEGQRDEKMKEQSKYAMQYEVEKNAVDRAKSAYEELDAAMTAVSRDGVEYKDLNISQETLDWAEANDVVISSEGDLADAVIAARDATYEHEQSMNNAETAMKHAQDEVDAYNGTIGGLTDKMNGLFDASADAIGKAESVGSQIMAGVGSGIESKAPSIAALAKGKVLNIVKAMKSTAEIASPSKLFKREVGAYIGEGVLSGIDESMSEDKITKLIGDQISGAVKKEQAQIISGGLFIQKSLAEKIRQEIDNGQTRYAQGEAASPVMSPYGTTSEPITPEGGRTEVDLLEETNDILREQTEILRGVKEDGISADLAPSLKLGGVINTSLKMVARS